MIDGLGALRGWWEKSELGQYVYAQERDFFRAAAQECGGRRALLAGAFAADAKSDFGLCGMVLQCGTLPADVLADAAALPWRGECFDTVLAMHPADFGADAHAVLAELYRVVRPYGHVVLTGFNPHSLWRIGGKVPQVAHSLPFARFKQCVAQTGWQVVRGRFIHYLPPVSRRVWIRRWRFLELAGNRWWPHGAAVYGVVLRKRQAGMRLQTDWADGRVFGGEMAVALARRAGKAANTR